MSNFPEGDLAILAAAQGLGGAVESEQTDSRYTQQRFAFEGADSISSLMQQLHRSSAPAAVPAYGRQQQHDDSSTTPVQYERPGLTTDAFAQEVASSMGLQSSSAAAASQHNSNNFAPSVNQLAEDMEKTKASELVRRTADMGSGLVGDDANTVDAIVSYSFRWQGAESPSEFKATAEIMSKAFADAGHENINFNNIVFHFIIPST